MACNSTFLKAAKSSTFDNTAVVLICLTVHYKCTWWRWWWWWWWRWCAVVVQHCWVCPMPASRQQSVIATSSPSAVTRSPVFTVFSLVFCTLSYIHASLIACDLCSCSYSCRWNQGHIVFEIWGPHHQSGVYATNLIVFLSLCHIV